MRAALIFAAVAGFGCGASLPNGTGGGNGQDAGAGGGSAGAGGGGALVADSGLPLGLACATLNARRCDYYERCGLIEGTDPARRDCAAVLLATWCGPTRWSSRVAAGTLLYNPLFAQQCAAGFAGRSCEDFEQLPGPCGRITAPNVSPLQSCYDGYTECTESQVCRGATCPRTCQTLGAVGDVCQLDTDCRPLLYCRRTIAATGVGTCTALGVANAVCSKDEPCATGLACLSGRCLVAPAEGMPCAQAVCGDSAWCQFTPDGGTCVARRTVGQSCTDDVQCATGTLCLEQRCEPKVLAAAGSVCSERQVCPNGTVCVGAFGSQLGRCASPVAPGQPCTTAADCQKPLSCVADDGGTTSVCGYRLPNAFPCNEDRDCLLFSRCRRGTCMKIPSTGESCGEVGECLLGPCLKFADGGSTCSDRLGAGTRCTQDADCLSGRCVSGLCLLACVP